MSSEGTHVTFSNTALGLKRLHEPAVSMKAQLSSRLNHIAPVDGRLTLVMFLGNPIGWTMDSEVDTLISWKDHPRYSLFKEYCGEAISFV